MTDEEGVAALATKTAVETVHTLDVNTYHVGDKHFAYFAYGSCMNHASLSNSIGCQAGNHFIAPATLDGYRLTFNYPSVTKPFCCANIAVEGGASVEGALYHLPVEVLEALDRREGVFKGRYYRWPVEVRRSPAIRTRALCYRGLITVPHESAPSVHYRETMAQGLMDAGVSEAYRLNLLARMATLQLCK